MEVALPPGAQAAPNGLRLELLVLLGLVVPDLLRSRFLGHIQAAATGKRTL